MKTFAPLALLVTAAALGSASTAVLADEGTETASVEVKASMMLYGPDGHRLARVYSVSKDGDPQVILNSTLFTVPASTLSTVDGKLTTSLTKREITSSK